MNQKNIFISFFILLFGMMTILAGGRALFTQTGIEARGHIVPLVLWYNFLAGFLYIAVGIASLKMKRFTKKGAIFLAVGNLIILIYLGFHILTGGAYEFRTLVAMSFRTLIWFALAFYFTRNFLKKASTHL